MKLALTAVAVFAGLSGTVRLDAADQPDAAKARPNILWITSEDNGPQLGCYGDGYATTPHIDRLATRSVRYRTCWSNAPVCAPARTTIITGVFPTSTGSEHMRSNVPLPASMKMYPQLLRQAGYYCTNNSKEDYNVIKPDGVWDESSPRAHWKNRGAGQPFFAVINYTISHESQIRNKIDDRHRIHDPAKVSLPAYHPDTPEVRGDWAQYYDRMTMMDEQVGDSLQELEKAGLADDTIIFYYGDHGSGMPRSKRWPYSSGLRVPLLLHIPAKFAHLRPTDYLTGGESTRLISFVDLAPTLLSLLGMETPDWMQGHAFAGTRDAGPQPFLYGFRGRMDERLDLVRSVTDGRYVYMRHYMPHKPCGQYVSYMFQTPTTQVWKRLFDEGRLDAAQSRFWQRKPAEELFDLTTDPDEVHNLVDSAEHAAILERLRQAEQAQVRRVRDLGFLPEGEIHTRSEGSTPWDYGHSPAYPLERIVETARLASRDNQDGDTGRLVQKLNDSDSAVRYWAALGLLMRGQVGVAEASTVLKAALGDASPHVRTVAAQALAQFGAQSDRPAALDVLMELAAVDRHGIHVSVAALNALDELDGIAAPLRDRIAALPLRDPSTPARMGDYVERLITKTVSDLDAR